MSTPRVVVVDHYDSYTWNLVHLVASVTGELPRVVEHDDVTLDELTGYTHVVLSPGPGHPDDPADFALGREVFELGLPVLGVCLGMQALVSAYGGTVGQVEPSHGDVAHVEHDGTGVFAGIPSPFDAVRYHSLAALAVPGALVVTARVVERVETANLASVSTGSTARDSIVMGVAHREKALWGVQFHPESILTQHGAAIIRNFLA